VQSIILVLVHPARGVKDFEFVEKPVSDQSFKRYDVDDIGGCDFEEEEEFGFEKGFVDTKNNALNFGCNFFTAEVFVAADDGNMNTASPLDCQIDGVFKGTYWVLRG
jgi:hypothetical protein